MSPLRYRCATSPLVSGLRYLPLVQRLSIFALGRVPQAHWSRDCATYLSFKDYQSLLSAGCHKPTTWLQSITKITNCQLFVMQYLIFQKQIFYLIIAHKRPLSLEKISTSKSKASFIFSFVKTSSRFPQTAIFPSFKIIPLLNNGKISSIL